MPLSLDRLNAILLPRLPELLHEMLPGGTMQGREYVCADLRGGPGDAIRVNLDKGLGRNLLTKEVYADTIAIWAAANGIGVTEAAQQLADRVGYYVEPPNVPVKVAVAVMPDEESAGQGTIALWENLGVSVSRSGVPTINIDNVMRVLEKHGDLKNLVWFDDFYKRVQTRWSYGTNLNGSAPVREWSEVDEINLVIYLQREVRLRKITLDVVRHAIMSYANAHPRNEPREWMESLRWDRTDRIKFFFHEGLGTLDNEYSYCVSQNFWISMVARIMTPGCQMDDMFILEGPQGTFKSSALRMIGGKWFSEMSGSVLKKDFLQDMQGKMLIEVSELEAFRKAEVQALKSFLSRGIDRFRWSYGRMPQDYPRQTIFVGTTNEKHYLRDETGARRFYPVRCGVINLDYIRECREQLFAEALVRFNDGEKWHEVPKHLAEAEQEERRVEDGWEDDITAYCQGRDDITMRDVAVNCLKFDMSRLGIGEQRRIGTCLRRAGYEKFKIKNLNGTQESVWRRQDIPEG